MGVGTCLQRSNPKYINVEKVMDNSSQSLMTVATDLGKASVSYGASSTFKRNLTFTEPYEAKANGKFVARIEVGKDHSPLCGLETIS